MRSRKRGVSIKYSTAVYSVVVILFISSVIVFTGYHLFKKDVKEHYTKYATTVLDNAYIIVDEYSFGDMIAAREMPKEYEEMREKLNQIKENSDIEYLYAVYFEDKNDIHSLTYAINTKTTEELKKGGKYTYLGTPCEEGSFEDDTLDTLLKTVKRERTESAVLEGYSSEYGHMLNGYRVIFDSKGKAAGLLCVEIDINNITRDLQRYIASIVIFVLIFTIVVTYLFVSKFEKGIIYPIMGIADSANDFVECLDNHDALDESVNKLIMQRNHSNNEIGLLYGSVSKMETEIAKQIRDISQNNKNISMLQNGLMVLMADLVAVRDSDTGAHIQKTAEYVRILLEGLKSKGYYSEILTSQYIDDVVKSAPLHDVGKIHIPDSILNKPSKLTEEEYKIMKSHTTFGKDVIDRAINSVEGESYLLEARNMAAYHHERWDGKGYPEGLSEEEIPLSARVMAVADVFDALTSPRKYKPGFPLTKALDLIREGDGTQFDPKIVEVLVDCLPEMKEVLKKFYPDYEE